MVHRTQRAAGVRRSAGRLWPHGHALGFRALRHRAGPGVVRQRDVQLAADLGGGRAARCDGPASGGQHDFDAHRQPGVLRGGAGLHRPGGRRRPGRERAAGGRGFAPPAASAGIAVSADRRRDGQRAGRGRGLRGSRRPRTGRRPGLGSGGELRRKRRADVQPRRAGRRNGQNLASAGDHRSRHPG